MEKRIYQKYIVSGVKNRFSFTTLGFKIRKRKRRTIETDKERKCRVNIDGMSYVGELVQKKQNKYTVEVNGNCYKFTIEQDNTVRRKAHLAKESEGKAFSLKSPMPGKICEVFVSKGTRIKKGEPLLILEAMKMQNQVLASSDAIVTAVRIKKGDTVFGDQVLLDFET